jgi:hypothetical protein
MGVGVSNTRNVVENSVKSSIETSMKASVDAAMNIACDNRQVVENVQNCSIKFGPQVCKAAGIANVTNTANMDTAVTQEITNQIQQTAQAETGGIVIGFQMSTASNIMKNTNDIAINTQQQFLTNCTKNISAINEQRVSNTTCDVVKAANIEFAAQEIDMSVIGDCVADFVGKSSASQTLTNILDQKATATVKGVDPWSLVVLLLLVLLAPIMIPVGFRILTKPHKKQQEQPTPEQAAADSGRRIAYWLLLLLLLMIMFWYPGLGAYLLGIRPWPARMPFNNGTAACRQDKLVDPSLIINNFMWWDADCTSPGHEGACTDEKRAKHYEDCGLFASTGGCDDPQFAKDKAQFIGAQRACAALGGADQSLLACTTQHAAAAAFDDGVASKGGYEGCKICPYVVGDDGELWHTYVGKRDGCTPSDTDDCMHKCDATKINLHSYVRNKDAPCGADDLAFCLEDEAALKRVSPNDCMSNAYQTRKMKFSKLLRACDALDEVAAVNSKTNGGVRPPMDAQCPPGITDYLTKCRKSADGVACTYRAYGCKDCNEKGEDCDCSAASASAAASCTNSLEGCTDPDYLTDFNQWQQWNDICAANWKQNDDLNKWAFPVTMAVYALVVAVMIWSFIHSSKMAVSVGLMRAGISEVPGGGGGGGLSMGGGSALKYSIAANPVLAWGTLLILGLAFLAAGPPFGMLGLVYEMPPVYTEGKFADKNLDSFKAKDHKARAITLTATTGLAFLVWLLLILKWRSELRGLGPEAASAYRSNGNIFNGPGSVGGGYSHPAAPAYAHPAPQSYAHPAAPAYAHPAPQSYAHPAPPAYAHPAQVYAHPAPQAHSAPLLDAHIIHPS